MKQLSALAGIAGLGLLTASCVGLGESAAPAAAPVIVTNNIPSGGDSGTTVLLAVVGIVAFLLLAGVIILGMSWANEKRRRTAAEDAVVALTGRPISQLAFAMAAPVSTEHLTAERHKELR